MRAQSAAIAGAGIAGLATALGLARAGLSVSLADRRAELSEVGAGLQVSPNALKALEFLGLKDDALNIASRPEALAIRRFDDASVLTSIPASAIEARFGVPYLTLHRAELQGLLVDAVRAHPHVDLFLGTQILGFAGGVALTSDEEGLRGEIGVIADGVHSHLRPYVTQFEAPDFAFECAYRGLIPRGALEDDVFASQITIAMGPGLHLVAYPVKQGEMVNVVVVERSGRWTEPDWSAPADRDAFLSLFRKWAPPFQRLVASIEDPTRWALYDRAVPEVWTRNGQVLIGDAAHAIVPHQAQGAALALEDAVVLSRLVAEDLPLERFGDLRATRCAKARKTARLNARLYQLSPAPVTRLRNWGLGQVLRVRPDFLIGLFEDAWSYDPATVTLDPS